MYGVSYASVYSAEQYIISSLTAVLFATFPLIVALLSHYLLPSDKLKGWAWPGMVVGLAGVVTISWHTLELSGELFRGAMLALLASLASATGVVLHKRHAVKVDIVVAATIQMILGTCVLLSGAIFTESLGDMVWTPTAIGSIFYLAVFGTVIAFLGYYWLMTHINVVSAAMIAFVTPLVASLIGMAFADESFTTPTAIGGAMILLSIALVTWSRRPQSQSPAR
jgi:drug/metabolite transporter (DMT)-like permease